MNDLVMYKDVGNPIEASIMLGKIFHNSRMFGCATPEQGAVLALYCITTNQDPFSVKRSYHIATNGMLTMRADAMLAEFIKIGGKFNWVKDGSDGIATLHVEINGASGDVSYSIIDAKRAKLVKQDSGWEKNPDAMLRARVTSKAIRMYAPQIVAGTYTPEEAAEDIQQEPLLPIITTETKPDADSKPEEKKEVKVQKETKKTEEPKPEKKVEPEQKVEQVKEEAKLIPKAESKASVVDANYNDIQEEKKEVSSLIKKIQSIIDAIGKENELKADVFVNKRHKANSLKEINEAYADTVLKNIAQFKKLVLETVV